MSNKWIRPLILVLGVLAFVSGSVVAGAKIAVRLSYEERCGFASAGLERYVVNDSNRTVVVTVKKTGLEFPARNRSTTDEHTVLAGEQKFLGCSRSGGTEAIEYFYAITGARYKE